MNKEEFHKYLVSPDKLDKKSILEVHELINEFPYFQTAHMMLLKNLYLLGNIKFDSQLRKSAAYIGNRTILYYLLQQKEVIEGVKESEQKQKGKIEKPVEKKLKEKAPEKKEKIISEKPEAKEPEKKEKEPVEKPKKDALADIVLKRIEEIKKTQKGSGAGKSASSSKESTSKSDTTTGEKKKSEKKEEDQVADPGTDQILQLASDDAFKQDIAEDKGKIISDKKEGTSDDNELIELDEDKEGKMRSDELIDRFIMESPAIKPRKMSNSDKEKKDISEFSVEGNDEFITETLAKIYISQGYYSKAIFAYEKLSLKFPEKSSYFASQIKNIKKIINEL